MTPTLNLDTVYVTTPSRNAPKFVFTASELPLLDQWLNHQFPGTKLHTTINCIVHEDGSTFARVAKPKDLLSQVNSLLARIGAQTSILHKHGDIFATPGTHDSTLILSDGTTTIEGNAAEIVRALAQLPQDDGSAVEARIVMAWAALAHFPKRFSTEQHEPTEAELEHWQDMCHEQYTGA